MPTADDFKESYRAMFNRQDAVAEVPVCNAILISPREWAALQSILGDLSDIHRGTKGRSLDTTVVSGNVLANMTGQLEALWRLVPEPANEFLVENRSSRLVELAKALCEEIKQKAIDSSFWESYQTYSDFRDELQALIALGEE